MATGTAKETILQRVVEKLRLPGVNIRTQPIRNRIDMLSTGIRTQAGVQVFGNDLTTIEQKETEIELGCKTRSLLLLHSSR